MAKKSNKTSKKFIFAVLFGGFSMPIKSDLTILKISMKEQSERLLVAIAFPPVAGAERQDFCLSAQLSLTLS